MDLDEVGDLGAAGLDDDHSWLGDLAPREPEGVGVPEDPDVPKTDPPKPDPKKVAKKGTRKNDEEIEIHIDPKFESSKKKSKNNSERRAQQQ